MIEVSSQRLALGKPKTIRSLHFWGLFQAAREEYSKHFAGMIPMDRARPGLGL